MKREEVLEVITEMLTSIRTVNQEALKEISEESDFIADLGLPSTDLINVIAQAEEKFDIEFDDDDVDMLGSKVSDTIDLVIKTLEKQLS